MVACALLELVIDTLVLRPLRRRNATPDPDDRHRQPPAHLLNNRAQGGVRHPDNALPGRSCRRSALPGRADGDVLELGIILHGGAVRGRGALADAARHRQIAKAAALLGINVEDLFALTCRPPRRWARR